jgi:hypothetical protein
MSLNSRMIRWTNAETVVKNLRVIRANMLNDLEQSILQSRDTILGYTASEDLVRGTPAHEDLLRDIATEFKMLNKKEDDLKRIETEMELAELEAQGAFVEITEADWMTF